MLERAGYTTVDQVRDARRRRLSHQKNCTFRRRDKTGCDIERRGLAGSIRPNEADNLVRADGERNTLKRLQATKILAYLRYRKEIFAGCTALGRRQLDIARRMRNFEFGPEPL